MTNAILVTGGSGYIGSHTCKVLAARGWTPVVLDDCVRGHRAAVRWGPLYVGDIADTALLQRILHEHQIRAMVHFAAYAYVGESTANPAMYYRNNVAGTLSLLEAMRAAGVGNLVFSSTCAVYGVPDSVPIAEDAPRRPINPYGRSKLMVEQILEDSRVAYGLRSVALRYFNAAGADPDGEIGEVHDPEPHLLPLVLDAAAGKLPHLTVFGSDYPTPDGTCVRDYIHVTDLAEAHALAAGHLLSGGEGMQLNLGNAAGYSVKEVIETAERVTGKKVPYRLEPRRAGDPPELVGDASKAKKVLGWNPQHGSLETILRHAWAWHQRKEPWPSKKA
jgi:UDP-arabinose 4-epimerase